MSPERLAEIEARAHLTDEAETLGFALTAHERDVRDLLAEVKRLRAGIEEALMTTHDDFAADALADLLNPEP